MLSCRKSMIFVRAQANKVIMKTALFTSIFSVCLLMFSAAHAQTRFDVFPTKTEQDIPYRIPAIAALPDGTVICVADYRHSRCDIGIRKDGRLDLHLRISRDNGNTWGDITPLVEGRGSESPDFLNVAFGDPCIVADRTSGKILVMSCAGNVSFPQGQRDLHQNIVCFYSEDGGRTWDGPRDVAESIYRQFDEQAPVKSMFVASGRILQSRYVRKNGMYRLYCAVMTNSYDGSKKNYVLYSDDFGKNWSVLGGPERAPIPSDADEAKVEELPGGSVLISSRTEAGGRLFNIFRFANKRKATGRWGEMVHSSSHNGGIITQKNACNGELLLVPVIRTADGRKMDLLMQSAPIGPYRSNVGIYYKPLNSRGDYSTSEAIARDWEGVCRVSDKGSAYSTMTLQADGSLGFLMEEQTHCTTAGGGYTIVYNRLTISDMTDGRYRLDTSRLPK